MALGDLYFDVLFKDRTDEGVKAIKAKLSKMGAEVGGDIADGIQSKLGNLNVNIKATIQGLNPTQFTSPIDVKANVLIDKDKLRNDIEDAVKSVKSNIFCTFIVLY